jgi:hypothetical protein
MYNSESFSVRRDRLPQQLSDPNALGILDPNLQEIFQIVDTLVPLECCVYYQIIPLSVTDNSLNLGMVNPEDTTAINYIRSTIKYLNYHLKPQAIEASTHEVILSTYLKYHQAKEIKKKAANISSATPADVPDRQQISENSTFAITPPQSFSSHLDVKISEDLALACHEKPTIVAVPITSFTIDKSLNKTVDPPSQELVSESKKIELSPQTTPQQLSKKLLVKVLQGEIGRVYFERHHNYGKIICSQEGTIQYSIDKLSLELFQGTIDEFKLLVNLPNNNTEKIQKIEIEKTYKQEQILLRLQIITNPKGEEGTLQVLRGKALQFYKQNKLEQMGKQALELAQKLERKLYQIYAYSSDRDSSSESLVAIQTITQKLSRHLGHLE